MTSEISSLMSAYDAMDFDSRSQFLTMLIERGPSIPRVDVDVTNQPNLSEQARKVRADKGQRLSDERMRCRMTVDGHDGPDRCVRRSGGPRLKFLCTLCAGHSKDNA